MPEGNGTGRLDRIEALLEKTAERLDRIATSQYLHDERLSRVEVLHEENEERWKQTNTGINSLVGAIRELIDRIPAENLSAGPEPRR